MLPLCSITKTLTTLRKSVMQKQGKAGSQERKTPENVKKDNSVIKDTSHLNTLLRVRSIATARFNFPAVKMLISSFLVFVTVVLK